MSVRRTIAACLLTVALAPAARGADVATAFSALAGVKPINQAANATSAAGYAEDNAPELAAWCEPTTNTGGFRGRAVPLAIDGRGWSMKTEIDLGPYDGVALVGNGYGELLVESAFVPTAGVSVGGPVSRWVNTNLNRAAGTFAAKPGGSVELRGLQFDQRGRRMPLIQINTGDGFWAGAWGLAGTVVAWLGRVLAAPLCWIVVLVGASLGAMGWHGYQVCQTLLAERAKADARGDRHEQWLRTEHVAMVQAINGVEGILARDLAGREAEGERLASYTFEMREGRKAAVVIRDLLADFGAQLADLTTMLAAETRRRRATQ